MEDYERALYWEKTCKKETERANWYKKQLAKTQEILGRVVLQYSDRWDEVTLTNYPPRKETK